MKFKKSLLIICLIICLFAIASVSATDTDDSAISSEDTGEIELSHEIESADENLGTSEEQTVTQTDNEEKTGATDHGTFWALQSKIESASSGDTVYLENNYSCEDSWTQDTGISISTPNLVIDGQGYTIDAKGKTRIFIVKADNVTIKNIKFINAKINDDEGAAILWYESDGGSVSGCSFVNCSAVYGGAIYWDNSANGIISDCAFIKCTASYGKAIRIWTSSVSLDCNWFGNTAENYESSPNEYIFGASTGNWLFLNATVNPESISTAQTADIIFKLYLYNNTGITDYTSLAKVDLALNSNGILDKNVTGLDEKVKFTPTSIGTGNITATIGNVAYTITLTVTDGTTFWDLNKTINGNTNDTITLDRDYAYNPDSDSAFTDGIMITRPVTINGNGHTIDAKGKVSVFYVKANDVTIKNLTIKNAHMDGYGGAIYLGMVDGCIVSQCNFIN
ncbi:MAG: hypothetical protein IKF66_00945, partial [Methanobrevibacter sp.]|nr:hypothetical protein [Methanobrevibacter sp.]